MNLFSKQRQQWACRRSEHHDEYIVLMDEQAGMPQIAPGVTMEAAEGHSLRVTSRNEDILLHEGTKKVRVLFKDRTPVPVTL